MKAKSIIPEPGKQPILDTSIRSEQFSSDTLGGKGKRKINISNLQITSPANNETLVNPEGQIMFTIAMGPDAALPQGYTTEILMNGNLVSNDDSAQIAVPVPENGRHEFEARIVSSNGVLLVKSETVRIDVLTN